MLCYYMKFCGGFFYIYFIVQKLVKFFFFQLKKIKEILLKEIMMVGKIKLFNLDYVFILIIFRFILKIVREVDLI